MEKPVHIPTKEIKSISGAERAFQKMLLINCTACGKQVSTKAKACPNCGHPIAEMQASLPVTNIKCSYCGKDMASNVETCPHCHRIVQTSSFGASDVSAFLIVGGILCSMFFWFFYDTSVSTGFGNVNNIGLMQNRQLGLIAGIGLVIVGVIVLAISKKRDCPPQLIVNVQRPFHYLGK